MDNNNLVLPTDYGTFDDSEIIGGIERRQGYLSLYQYNLRAKNDSFCLYDGNELVKSGSTIKNVVLLHYHSVMSLVSTPQNKDEKPETLAITYGNPWKPGKGYSRGDFDIKGYGKYLDDKNLSKQLRRRIYCFMTIDGQFSKNVVAASFGVTTYKSLNELIKITDAANMPVSAVFLNLSTVKDISGNNENYDRVCFDIDIDSVTGPRFSSKNVQEYREYISPLIEKVIKTHHGVLGNYPDSQKQLAAPADPGRQAITDEKAILLDAAKIPQAEAEKIYKKANSEMDLKYLILKYKIEEVIPIDNRVDFDNIPFEDLNYLYGKCSQAGWSESEMSDVPNHIAYLIETGKIQKTAVPKNDLVEDDDVPF